MKRVFALLLVLLLAVSFMSVTVSAGVFDGGVLGSSDSEPNVDNKKKDFPDDASGTSDPSAETTVATEETTVATEETTVATEETTVATEETDTTPVPPVENTGATESETGLNTRLEIDPQTVDNSAEQTEEEVPQTDSDNETVLLIALIAGLGAICAVLVIRRGLDV